MSTFRASHEFLFYFIFLLRWSEGPMQTPDESFRHFLFFHLHSSYAANIYKNAVDRNDS